MIPDPAFLSSLDPTPPWFQGGGAVLHVPSLKDYSALSLPGVAELLHAGALDPVDWSEEIKFVENQGQEGACVGFSTATDNSFLNYRADRGWDRGDGRKLWQELGGVGQNGVDSRATLERVRAEGAPLQAGGRLKGISAYTFAPRVPGTWRQTIAAGLSLGKGCVVALLLPPDLGWNSGSGKTTLYHQMKAVGFTGIGDGDYCIFVNSWGPSFGNRGFCRVPWIQMEGDNFQQGYVYAFVNDPLVEVTPPPPPPPVQDYAQKIVDLTNAHRQSKGLRPLAVLPALAASALAKSRDMGEQRYFAHEHQGKGPLQWMREAGLAGETHWGENIAGGQTEPGAYENARVASATRDGAELHYGKDIRNNPGGAFTDWLNSPGHRANIEFPGFTHIGVGHAVVQGSPYVNYYTQHFAALGGDTNPPPPVERISIKGTLTGAGLATVKTGTQLAAQGGGFSGNLLVTEAEGHVTPLPPPPPPVGDLTVKVDPFLRRLWTLTCSAFDRNGTPVSASFMAQVNGVLVHGRGGSFFNVPRNSTVVVTATATDGRRGQTTLNLT